MTPSGENQKDIMDKRESLGGATRVQMKRAYKHNMQNSSLGPSLKPTRRLVLNS